MVGSSASKLRAPRASVRRRVIVGLTAIMVSFSALTIYSIFLHRRTVAQFALINNSYLPLSLRTEKIRATQEIFNTYMDRLPDDPRQSVTREWIDAARRLRPSMMHELSAVVDQTLRGGIPKREARFLSEIRARLRQVEQRYADNEPQFQQVYMLLDTARTKEARVHIEGLKRVERDLDRVLLASIGEEILRHVTSLTLEAAREGKQATWLLAVLTLVALVIAGATVIATSRLLAPLRALLQAVEKVAGGQISTRIDVARDNDIGALARGFNRMTDALAERDQMLIRSARLAAAGKMAAQVTHEIRNPLSSLGLNAELLEDELRGGPEMDEARALLGAVQDEIARLTGITEAYLRFARLPSPEPSFGDLNALVTSALDFMRQEIASRDIETSAELASGIGQVLFDRNQIRQALVNLLRNACEAMPDGGELRVTTRNAGDNVEIAVTDTGGGVPVEAQEQIFESFFSTKSGGTGLGLPLVRQICQAHAGDVRCHQTSSSGSAFVIALPAIRATETKGGEEA